MRVHLMDLPFAVISCVLLYSHSDIPKPIHRSHVQSQPKIKAAKEGAFKESVEWFIKYLQ
jgi:hypothetical protein